MSEANWKTMKIYFEDGPLRDEIEIPGEILLARVDAINGVSVNREDLDLLHSYSKEHSVSIYTNSIFAFCNKYAWNDELKVPEIYIRHGENDEFTRIDKLTNRELRQAHNLARMYVAGEFSGVEEEEDIVTFGDIYKEFKTNYPDFAMDVADYRPYCPPYIDTNRPWNIVLWMKDGTIKRYSYETKKLYPVYVEEET